MPLRSSDSLPIEVVDAMVKETKAAGFDFIKILSISTAEYFAALVESCKKYHFKVAGHCVKPIDYELALKSQVYESIEHLHGYAWLIGFEKMLSTLDEGIINNVAITPATDWCYYSPSTSDELKSRSGLKYVSKVLKKQWQKDVDAELDNESGTSRYMYCAAQNSYEYRNKLTGFAYKQGANLLVGPD